MGERASCRIDIAALKLLFCQISYASRVFFTLTMHPGLLPNFALSRSHLILGPSVHRLSPQEPHFLDKPLFDDVSLPEISLRIHYSKRYRCESIAKTRVRLKNCQKRFIAEFRRRHCPTSIDSRISSIRRITLNRTLLVLITSDADNEWDMMTRERLPMARLLRFKMNRVRHVPGEQLRVDVTPGVIGKKERW